MKNNPFHFCQTAACAAMFLVSAFTAPGLPMYFERHAAAEEADAYLARTRSGAVRVHGGGFAVELQKVSPATENDGKREFRNRPFTAHLVRFELVNAREQVRISGLEGLAGRVNYLLGSDPSQWRTGLPIFGRVRVEDVYPGVDLVYYGNDQRLEYDFVLAPRTSPDQISLRIHGADKLELDAQGDLLVYVQGEVLRQHRPVLHQEIEGKRVPVEGQFQLDGNTLSFQVGNYDPDHKLVIDPILSYSTFLGGSGFEHGWDIALGPDGSVFVAGDTSSANLPVTSGAFRSTYGGTIGNQGGDAFVAKFNNTGTALEYLTYIGGRGVDAALGIAVDGTGNAYITGVTSSTNFPLANAISNRLGGTAEIFFGAYPYDAFVAKLNPTGSGLIYSTFIGGDDQDQGLGIAIDPLGQAYITGYTWSEDFPIVNGVTNRLPTGSDAFVTKLNAQGSAFVYSTFLGGQAADHGGGIAVDADQNAVVVGYTLSRDFPVTNALQNLLNLSTNNAAYSDAFVTRFNPAGRILYSTYLGGWAGEYGYRVALDSQQNAYVTGTTASTNFPATISSLPSGSRTNLLNREVFLAKIAPAGTLVYATAFGGVGKDEPWDLAVDVVGNVVIAGGTEATNFPAFAAPPGLLNTNPPGEDVFVSYINQDASAFIYSGMLGGAGNERAYGVEVDPTGNVYLCGQTSSTDFPVLAASQGQLAGTSDAFFAKISLEPVLAVSAEAAGQVTISWPGFNPEYRLETTTTPAKPAWQPVGAPVQFSAGKHSVTLPHQGAAIFRLAR